MFNRQRAPPRAIATPCDTCIVQGPRLSEQRRSRIEIVTHLLCGQGWAETRNDINVPSEACHRKPWHPRSRFPGQATHQGVTGDWAKAVIRTCNVKRDSHPFGDEADLQDNFVLSYPENRTPDTPTPSLRLTPDSPRLQVRCPCAAHRSFGTTETPQDAAGDPPRKAAPVWHLRRGRRTRCRRSS